jgi:hypothetical protein
MERLRLLKKFQCAPLVGLIICITLFSCQNKKHISYEEISKLNFEESLKIIDREKDPVNWVQLVEKKISNFKNDSTRVTQTNRAVKYLSKRSLAENNPIGQNAYERIKSYQFITLGQIDSAIHYAQKARLSSKLHDSINLMMTYQCLGVAYYYQNQNSDSTRKYWQKGYKEAVLTKNNLMIELFATNLGSFYYNNGNTRNARNLFLIASEASLKIKRPSAILINNIICTLMDESEYKQADAFWIKHQKILNEDLASYNGQLYLLNRVRLLHVLGRYKESNNLLATLKTEQLNKTLYKEFASVSLINQVANGSFKGFRDSFLKPIIQEHIVYCAYNLSTILKEQINQPEIKALLSEINRYCLDTSQLNDLSKTYQSGIYALLAHYNEQTNPAKAIQLYKNAIRTKNESIEEQNQIQNRTIEEFQQLENLFVEIRNKEEIISEQNKQQRVTLSLFGFVLIIVVLGIWITRNNLKIKNIKQKQLETEQRALKKENELSNRIVEYSKSMIERNEKIKKEILNTIETAPIKFKIGVTQIFKDFQFNNPISEAENPKIANQIIQEKDDWNVQFPGFNDLNKTEQRVLALTMELYRPKEVANVLGVSTQYVRNVKTRLKLKLNLPDNWGA